MILHAHAKRTAVAVVASGLLAGCGTTASFPAASSSLVSGSSSAAASTCTIYAQQHDAQIVVSPGDQSECNELIKDLASSGVFWSYTPNGQAVGNLTQACDVTSSDGTYEAVVLDDSGGFIGQSVCPDFTAAGWMVSQTPGPLAQHIAQQAGQQQQAQASQSAAAATQQQIAGLQSSLQSDVSTLASDAASLDNDNSLATDVQGMKNDVAAENKDYATVQADDCSSRPGDAGSVDGDAGSVDGDQGSVQGDISSLQSNSVSGDISKVQGDVSQLKSLGASPDTDPAAALAAGHKALKDMASAISWAQGQASQLDGQAHQIAKQADALAAQCNG